MVGAGIAGSAVATEARRRGLDVLIIDRDSSRAASRCALALLHPGWLPREPSAVETARATYGPHVTTAGATVTGYPAGAPHPEADWWAVNPPAVLVDPDLTTEVRAAAPGRVDTDAGPVRAHAIVLAMGPTKLWGPARCTYGHTLIAPGQLDRRLLIHRRNPYATWALVDHGDGWLRAGATVAKTREQAERLVPQLREWAARAAHVPAGRWRVMAGLRVMPDPGQLPGAILELAEGSCFAITGMGRLGYSVAPTRAGQLLDRLGAA